MTNCRFAASAALAPTLAIGAGEGAFAQLAPSPAASAAAKVPSFPPEIQKAAFLAMSEPDRKAVQDALVWLGLDNGEFGTRTLDSIVAYQASVKAPVDGVVSAQQLAALKTAAEKARAGVAFQTLDDAATGIRIGAPMKLMEKRSGAAGQTRLPSRDRSISLGLLAPPGGQNSLSELFQRLTADAQGRKATYKTLKPGAFFVVSGEEGGAVRGFSFAFPTAKAGDLDRDALAILNSFEPFAAKTLPAPAIAPRAPTASASAPAEMANAPGGSPTPTAPILTATALVVAPGQALTALSEADCRTPVIAGKPTKFASAEAATGLALLSGEFGPGAAPLRSGMGGSDLIVLGLAPGAGPGKAVLEAADATLTPISGTRPAVVAAISLSARGAPVFNRQAGHISIVAPIAAGPKRLGAVVLAEPHELIGAEALRTFIPLPNAEPASGKPPLSAADIASDMRGAIVGVYCAP